MPTPSTTTILNYHNRTKHTLERYAKSPDTLDWDDQPDPFRRFSGCEVVPLPRPGAMLQTLFAQFDTPHLIPKQPLNRASLGLLLELSFGLSAWKAYGPNRWSLRCNPSSGNLHPTEAYLINTDGMLMKPGLYHYVSYDHHLEQRCQFADPSNDVGLLIGLSSVHWREAWKYGERAYRYCQHDTGHALGALRYAAATLGWSIELVTRYSDDETAFLLGLNRSHDFIDNEHEFPDFICRIHTRSNHAPLPAQALLEAARDGVWSGKADSLRAYHLYKWPVIDEVAHAAKKWHTADANWQAAPQHLIKSVCHTSAVDIIRSRRSAQHFDGTLSPLPSSDFYRMLSAVLPAAKIPFDSWPWSPKVHLFIFVHRVEGLPSGLYALPRSTDVLQKLKAATLADFAWQTVSDDLPLYQLYPGDFRQTAKTLSCRQAIAGDSAFSLAMLAEFSEPLEEQAWNYRRLFWECGLIGQVLYLEAEAAGVRGTGIGCFFDDSVHEIFGIKDNSFQSLYHFTVGRPLEDQRLQTLPAYGHLPAL
ncbi:MAG: SagB/ThcOx family dehydrogenase [Methylovulum sp.]|nr:SagB/ThcOx family dehydrogenase [Methylovulum sp.]